MMMAVGLRFGVAALLSSAALVVGLLVWGWQSWWWRTHFMVNESLPTLAASVSTSASAQGISKGHLQQQLLLLFAPSGNDLQLQAEADRLHLRVLLRPSALGILQHLPNWPGWYLESMHLQAAQGRWSLTMVWQLEHAAQLELGQRLDADLDDWLAPKAVSGLQLAVWQTNDNTLPLVADDGATDATVGDYVLLPSWYLLGVWGQGVRQGVWLRDANKKVQQVSVGGVQGDWLLLSVNSAEVIWQHVEGQRVVQPVCLFAGLCDD